MKISFRKRLPSSPTPSKRRSVWTARAILTAGTLASGLLLQAASIAAPYWAAGETYHVASSSAFHVDFSAGLWGYCSTAKSLDGTPSAIDQEKEVCVAFHSTIGTQELSVCEAYSRGFVYGTDDVRGVPLPLEASEDVHRIPRPPTSLDDMHIQRFIEKSCGVEGAATMTLGSVSFLMAVCTLIAFVWTLGKPQPLLHELRASPAKTNVSLLQFSSLAAFAAVISWHHQSWDLRNTGDHVSIRLGLAVYAQLAVAALFCIAGMGILATDAERARRGRSILKF